MVMAILGSAFVMLSPILLTFLLFEKCRLRNKLVFLFFYVCSVLVAVLVTYEQTQGTYKSDENLSMGEEYDVTTANEGAGECMVLMSRNAPGEHLIQYYVLKYSHKLHEGVYICTRDRSGNKTLIKPETTAYIKK